MNWHNCTKILCVRLDHIGDIIMSSPAIHALKKTFGCRITLLTSAAGAAVAPFVPGIDEVMVLDAPWMKQNGQPSPDEMMRMVEALKERAFDAAVIFSVYSQNPLPAALLTYLANIPLRLAYCRENPYHLLTHWVPDTEPYTCIRHQVKRDLHLVEQTGAVVADESLRLRAARKTLPKLWSMLKMIGVDCQKPFIIAHPGASDEKRKFPEALWIDTLNRIGTDLNMQILLTGSPEERALTNKIKNGISKNAFNTAGLFDLETFIDLIAESALVITVNTATQHIASALKKYVIALYAMTNPQHTPWQTEHALFPYSIPDHFKSKNQVIHFVNESYYRRPRPYPSPEVIVDQVAFALQQQTRPSFKANSVSPSNVLNNPVC